MRDANDQATLELPHHGGEPRIEGRAWFSKCGTYRYWLMRDSGVNLKTLTFIMLNPSTADEITNDPTVERCWRRALTLGYARLEVLNIFALRSTDPNALYAHADPVGEDNDGCLVTRAKQSDLVVCAWGEHGAYRGRGHAVRKMLEAAGVKLHALKINASGHPAHPLYLPYALQPREWRHEEIA